MGLVAKGMQISFNSFSGELIDIGGPGFDRDSSDMTHQESTDYWREFAEGYIDPGEVSITVAFDPDETPPIDGASGTVEITWPLPSGMTNAATWSCDGFVTHYEPNAPLGEKMTCDITIKWSGKPTFTAAS